MKLERVVTAERYNLSLSGKQGWSGNSVSLHLDGSVSIGDKYIYRSPELMAQRAKDRIAAGLTNEDPDPQYASKQDLQELADHMKQAWDAFKANLK